MGSTLICAVYVYRYDGGSLLKAHSNCILMPVEYTVIAYTEYQYYDGAYCLM